MFVIHSEYFTFMVRSDHIVAHYLMMDFVVIRHLVTNLCLLQVFNWEVKGTALEMDQLFSEFYAVCHKESSSLYL